jgi:hypothetical protein
MKLPVAAEFSALADVFECKLFDQDRHEFFFNPRCADQRFGEFLNNPSLLFNGETFFLFEYDNGHENTLQEMGRPDIYDVRVAGRDLKGIRTFMYIGAGVNVSVKNEESIRMRSGCTRYKNLPGLKDSG